MPIAAVHLVLDVHGSQGLRRPPRTRAFHALLQKRKRHDFPEAGQIPIHH
jgi:hypothetical protein